MSLYHLYRSRSLSLPQPGYGQAILRTPLLFLLLSFSVVSLPCAAQTKWFKYDGNPVLDLGPPGSWDGGCVYVNCVIREGKTYHLWYMGLDQPESITGNKPWKIGYAASANGISWRRHPRPVLEEGPTGSWDSGGALHCDVLFYGSTYHMWYSGFVAFPRTSIGYASSRNGIVWTKRPLPVLSPAPSGSWDSVGRNLSSVLPSDSGFQMWYTGWGTMDLSDCSICSATARDETTCVSLKQPPFRFHGRSSPWESPHTGLPRLINDGQHYQMWFIVAPTSRLAQSLMYRAISTDGVNWQMSPDDEPVLRPGENGSWDDVGLRPGEILFDGTLYHMWYTAFDGLVWRTGYAVSPQGLELSFPATKGYSLHQDDNIIVRVEAPRRESKSFTAHFRMPGVGSGRTVELYDDGLHEDSLAGDGVFAARWHPEEDRVYLVDLKMKRVEKGISSSFTMRDAARFTTIRHVSIDSLEFVKDLEPNPGDTLLVALLLRHGGTTSISDVTASLMPADSFSTGHTFSLLNIGNMAAGSLVRTTGYCRVIVNEDCPPGSTVKIKAILSSAGVPFLDQIFSLQVRLPWWKTAWARVVYVLLLLVLVIAVVHYVELSRLKKRILALEREKELEQERARISQDMNDEVGSNLSEIAILSELAKKQPDQASTRVNQISERTAELIDNVSEIVWAMNPKNDTLDNLVGYLRRYAVKYFNLAGVACEFLTPEEIPSRSLSADVRQAIFLAVKQLLHLVAEQREISVVRIKVVLSELSLEIGIQNERLAPALRKGVGSDAKLASFKVRIAEIGGELHIDASADGGARVVLTVPLAPAL